MYVPKAFAVDDRAALDAVIRDNGFGLLVTQGDGRPFATHLPFLLEGDSLVAHMARANPQWRDFAVAGEAGGAEALCVFQGPHAYVSPRWYAAGNAVPTWNYVAVHVYGVPQIVDDPAVVYDQMARLTAAYEMGSEAPWDLAGADRDTIDGMLRAIVAFRVPITRIEGKFKLNQNRDAADRRGVVAALGAADDPGARDVAALMAAREDE